jgi:hypothetical protein
MATIARSWSAASLISKPPHVRQAFLESLSPQEAESLLYDWSFWGANKQLPPPEGELVRLGGHGGARFGKTRTGAELVRKWVHDLPAVTHDRRDGG